MLCTDGMARLLLYRQARVQKQSISNPQTGLQILEELLRHEGVFGLFKGLTTKVRHAVHDRLSVGAKRRCLTQPATLLPFSLSSWWSCCRS